ncbi:MAG: hypothetical protein K6U03_01325 [Firmicutes bacterium]|nr:hypothetical protein [Bacillota bacterium]
MSTAEATGVWVPASRERLAEITTGNSYCRLGWEQPAKTRLIRGRPEADVEALGMAHEIVVAMRYG